MTFCEAYQVILQDDHARVRRLNWRAWLEWPDVAPYPSKIQMLWPSGARHRWQPTLEDVHANDWEVVPPPAAAGAEGKALASQVQDELLKALDRATRERLG